MINVIKKIKHINHISIKDNADVKNRENERGIKCNHRQRSSKKIHQILRGECNKQISTGGEINRAISKGRRIIIWD